MDGVGTGDQMKNIGGTMVKLTKGEAYALASIIDMKLIETIRDDTDIDSMLWLRNIVHAYEKLCEYSGYCGLTEVDNEAE